MRGREVNGAKDVHRGNFYLKQRGELLDALIVERSAIAIKIKDKLGFLGMCALLYREYPEIMRRLS